MAITSFSLAISMILLSLVVAASATGYGYAPKPAIQKPNKNGYGYAPKPEIEKPNTNGYASIPEIGKPNTNGYGYAPQPEIEKPKTNGYGYAPKPKLEKPNTSGYGYAPKPELGKPQTEGKPLPSVTGVQGIIYCKSGPELIPLEGALARITCLAVDNNGYESAPFSVLSHPTDAKGYFFATVSAYELEGTWQTTECKAFLEKSPLTTCQVPTDVNKGISGALLSSNYHLLQDKNIKLYSVGPFFYTPAPKPNPSNGY